jgi:GNAT superfamily N-acetyltransferase
MSEVVLTESSPTVAEYIALRQSMGWGTIDEAWARQSLENACFSACLRRDGRLVGLVRAIGDGCLYFAVSDVMVSPDLRGGGHGATLLKALGDYLRRSAKPGASITLQPLSGREPFYEKFGWVRCPGGPFGQGMVFADAPPPVDGRFARTHRSASSG